MNSSTMMISPLLHDVLLVAVKQVVRAQRRVQVMHEYDVGRVVEARVGFEQPRLLQQLLGVLVPLLGKDHLVLLLVHPVVAGAVLLFLLFLPHELGCDLVHPDVKIRSVLGLAGDDERRARLVDQDRIHFVDDRVGEPPLHLLRNLVHHVVAQVVEAEFVVGAVGDVGTRRPPASDRAPYATGSRRR